MPMSVVIQGVYDNGCAGGGDELGTLYCQAKTDYEETAVSLRAGDGLVLAEGLHRPEAVKDGEKRLVFVVFFSAMEGESN